MLWRAGGGTAAVPEDDGWRRALAAGAAHDGPRADLGRQQQAGRAVGTGAYCQTA